MGDIVVVSDVHGHLDDLRKGLRRAGLVDHDDRWAGGDSELWVLGDLMDRGPDGAGVVHLLRSLTQQEPDRVHVLLGNHEALALGYRLAGGPRLSESWHLNGGRADDQDALDGDDIAWLRTRPAMARVGDHLLVHSDSLVYRSWGSTVEEVNATVGGLLARDDAATLWDLWAKLTHRYDFVGPEGVGAARGMLELFGGRRIVHGHSIIASLLGVPPSLVTGPLGYADGLALAIDGGRYAGGPLLLVSLRDGLLPAS